MPNKHTQAIIRASGFYLATPLTEDQLKWEDADLYDFIEDHVLEPFEYWSPVAMYGLITKLADSFEELMI